MEALGIGHALRQVGLLAAQAVEIASGFLDRAGASSVSRYPRDGVCSRRWLARFGAAASGTSRDIRTEVEDEADFGRVDERAIGQRDPLEFIRVRPAGKDVEPLVARSLRSEREQRRGVVVRHETPQRRQQVARQRHARGQEQAASLRVEPAQRLPGFKQAERVQAGEARVTRGVDEHMDQPHIAPRRRIAAARRAPGWRTARDVEAWRRPSPADPGRR